MRSTDSKKKLYLYRPDRQPVSVECHRTKSKLRTERITPRAIERGVRQLLADKVSGNLLGTWLLVPEHLRLGTWEMLVGWSGASCRDVEPRLALQLVHESALCVNGIRYKRSLPQKGFELVNGLPFLATDLAIHQLLEAHTVEDAEAVQLHLGCIRRARQHFRGEVLAIDPHPMRSYSKRQTIRRKTDKNAKPVKATQTFFCLDTDTHQPVCVTTATAATTVTRATKGLLRLACDILHPKPHQTMVLADTEHYTVELIDHVCEHTPFDLLVPIPNHRNVQKQFQSMPDEAFTRRWAGYATARVPYRLKRMTTGPHWQVMQRAGERADEYVYKAFLTTHERDETDALTLQYPKRWHVEEFFNANQALGWKRAGTLNLHIRYAQMTMALVAQALIHEFRQRLGSPFDSWDAPHLARDVFNGLDGDLRVCGDTILVTFYNAPNAGRLRDHYENLPFKLQQENTDPRIPWLYDYKLDFRFK